MAAEDDDEPSYGNVRVPPTLNDRLDRFKEENDWGFRSKTEIVAQALREFFMRYDPKD